MGAVCPKEQQGGERPGDWAAAQSPAGKEGRVEIRHLKAAVSPCCPVKSSFPDREGDS